MAHFALSAIGRDRPGIVADIAGVLLSHGLNVEDSQMTILRGHFAMTLIVAAPDGPDVDALRGDLAAAAERLGLGATALSTLDEAATAARPEPSHIVTVYGADHPGILHAFSTAMAERAIDITDLDTRLAGDAETPLYALIMEVALESDAAAEELRAALERLAAEQGVEVTIRPLQADVL